MLDQTYFYNYLKKERIIMDKKWCIYIHINKINHKVYIGQTNQLPEKRWNKGLGYKKCPRFYQAIQKYGWNNFEHKILKENLSLEEANYWEEFYITKIYHSNQEQYGYNMTSGGQNKIPNQETLLKMSKGQKKYYKTIPSQKQQEIKQHCKTMHDIYMQKTTYEERLQNATPGLKAAQQYWKEHPEKKRELGKKNQKYGTAATCKSVKCLETGKIYPSSEAAARALNKNSGSNIRKSCRNGGKTKGNGFHWIFI